MANYALLNEEVHEGKLKPSTWNFDISTPRGVISHVGMSGYLVHVNGRVRDILGIEWVSTRPDFRGRRYATQLLDLALTYGKQAFLKSIPWIGLFSGADGLYLRAGFKYAPNLGPLGMIYELQPWDSEATIELPPEGAW